MDAYKTPESNLDPTSGRIFKPVKALTYGLFVSLGILLIASNIVGIIFLLLNRESISSLTNEREIQLFLANNIPFLLVDFFMSVAILFYAGTRIRRFACNQEIKYGFILASITFTILLAVYLVEKSYEIYPLWYSFIVFSSTFIAILLGAKPKT